MVEVVESEIEMAPDSSRTAMLDAICQWLETSGLRICSGCLKKF